MATPIRPYDGLPPSWRVPWRYARLHIPSGTVTKDVTEETTLVAFLMELSRWNAQQPGVWQYWREC